MIGLSGAQRCGKTTLARAFAEKNELEFVETSASTVFKSLGLDPAVTYDFATRLTVQEAILETFEVAYAEHSTKDSAITDRTPLDLMAYTLAEAIGDVVSAAEQSRLEKYIERCFEVINKRFSTLVVVQPGLPLVAEEGKAALNPGYIEHLNSLILGLSVDERVFAAHFYLPRHILSLDGRIAAVEYAVGSTRRKAVEMREKSGLSVH